MRTNPNMAYPLVLLAAFLSVGLVVAESSLSETYEVPRFRISDLRSGRRANDLKHVLETTGLLAITLDNDEKASHELTAHRTAAFDGLCKCAIPGHSNDAPLLSVTGTDSATLTDGVTVRTTLATATVGYTPLPLPAAELSSACDSSDRHFVDALEGLRDTVAEASSVFINALDGILSSPTNPVSTPLLKTSTGASYSSVRDVVGASKNLEHMHVYSRDDNIDGFSELSDETNNGDALRLHTDAGLFLSFIPALSCSDIGGLGNTDQSFQILDPLDGQVKVANFPQDVPSIAIMLGIGAERWLNTDQQKENVILKATRHKVGMRSGDRRAWYGMSKSSHPWRKFPTRQRPHNKVFFIDFYIYFYRPHHLAHSLNSMRSLQCTLSQTQPSFRRAPNEPLRTCDILSPTKGQWQLDALEMISKAMRPILLSDVDLIVRIASTKTQ